MNARVDQRLEQARDAYRRGDLTQARRRCRELLARTPAQAAAWRLLGLIQMQSGDVAGAIEAFRETLAYEPQDLDALGNLGVMLTDTADFDAAVAYYAKALAIRPDFAEMHFNLGNTLAAAGRTAEAVESFRAAVRLKPAFAICHNNLGVAYKRLKRFDEAIECFRRAIAADERCAPAHNNLGAALAARGLWREAIRYLRTATALNSKSVEAQGELARAYVESGEFTAAYEALRAALALNPELPNLWFNLACALMRGNQLDPALRCFEEVLARSRNDVESLVNVGSVLTRLKRPREGLQFLERASAVDSDAPFLWSFMLSARRALCDWQDFEDLRRRVMALAAGEANTVELLGLFAVCDEPEVHAACATSYRRWLNAQQGSAPRAVTRSHDERIRVAYVSPDFRDHPVGVSIVEVLERHDRERFDIIGISLSAHDGSDVVRRIATACSSFHEVALKPDHEIAGCMRDLDVDIAVDLSGYTANGRPRVLAARPARVQAAYLGYAGTLAAPWMDYLIADRIVIPESALSHYSERVIWLRETFFPSDTSQPLPPGSRTRAEEGLPDRGFVFCCFTNPARILPEVFDVWMRVLQAVDGSVLWLAATGVTADNLRTAAEARGVDGRRVIFAARLASRTEHLCRQRLADLFLDTYPYNGHSTARDALWAGLPVLTCCGRTFPSRVAASLLTAAGIPELIADSLDNYERLAVALAGDPERLSAVRARALSAPATPLFDTGRLTRELEEAYTDMLGRWAEQQARERARAPRTGLNEMVTFGGSA
jgi:predicted O-linked N-acetylglucosamine transferase (SPINDLY family)